MNSWTGCKERTIQTLVTRIFAYYSLLTCPCLPDHPYIEGVGCGKLLANILPAENADTESCRGQDCGDRRAVMKSPIVPIFWGGVPGVLPSSELDVLENVTLSARYRRMNSDD